jgi:hypothetical protein
MGRNFSAASYLMGRGKERVVSWDILGNYISSFFGDTIE